MLKYVIYAPVTRSTTSTQTVVSEYHPPIKGTGDSWKSSYFQDWGRAAPDEPVTLCSAKTSGSAQNRTGHEERAHEPTQKSSQGSKLEQSEQQNMQQYHCIMTYRIKKEYSCAHTNISE